MSGRIAGPDPRISAASGRSRVAAVIGPAVAALLLYGAAPSSTPPAGGIEFLPAAEIRPGMEGVARTVFAGNTIEEFKVEFLGVLKSAIGPQQDMILARLHGDKVEYTGVVSGMSGSPVYVDGKLVGAISYRLGPFAKEPIAGITPIADMVKLADGISGARARASGPGPDLLGRFLKMSADRTGPAEGSLSSVLQFPARAGLPAAAGMTSGLQPIGTPLVCAGCDPRILAYYAPIFEALGLEPTSGGGAASDEGPFPLLPGTAIGGALVTGDMGVTAIGTLTHIDGKRVFAFGHPLLGSGPLEIPMTQAQVLVTFPSAAASFKIANPTRPVGTVFEDSLTAIVGEVGRVPPTVPFRIRVASGAVHREFNFEVVKNRSWTPVMVALTTANSLVRTTEYDAAATLALRYRLDLEGHPAVEVEDLYSGTNPTQPVHVALANDAAGLLNLLYNNSFEEIALRRVEADIEVLQESQVATISSLSASRYEVRPGEPFTVTALLSPFRGPDRAVTFKVALPEDAMPGETQIVVGSGPAIDGLDRRVIERQVAQAGDLADLLRLVTRQRKSRSLYLRVMRRSPSAIVRSELLPNLPLSVFSVFNNPRLSADTTLIFEAPILEIPKDLDLVALGGRRITLRIK